MRDDGLFDEGDVGDLLLVERIGDARFFLFAGVEEVVFLVLLDAALEGVEFGGAAFKAGEATPVRSKRATQASSPSLEGVFLDFGTDELGLEVSPYGVNVGGLFDVGHL